MLKGAIVGYLARHSSAADTVEGIRDWWLKDVVPKPTIDELQIALDALVADGKIRRTTLIDGTTLYAGIGGTEQKLH